MFLTTVLSSLENTAHFRLRLSERVCNLGEPPKGFSGSGILFKGRNPGIYSKKGGRCGIAIMNGKIGDFEEWDSGNNQINEPRTLWLREAAGNKTKRKIEYRSTIPRVMMMTFHLWNERLIFTWEEVLASDGVFAPTAELCIVNFFYLLFYGTIGLPWPFVFYALVEIGIRFFDTDLPVPLCLSMIEV